MRKKDGDNKINETENHCMNIINYKKLEQQI